eukprot:8260-Heterococcus_DN1.PRE.2
MLLQTHNDSHQLPHLSHTAAASEIKKTSPLSVALLCSSEFASSLIVIFRLHLQRQDFYSYKHNNTTDTTTATRTTTSYYSVVHLSSLGVVAHVKQTKKWLIRLCTTTSRCTLQVPSATTACMQDTTTTDHYGHTTSCSSCSCV